MCCLILPFIQVFVTLFDHSVCIHSTIYTIRYTWILPLFEKHYTTFYLPFSIHFSLMRYSLHFILCTGIPTPLPPLTTILPFWRSIPHFYHSFYILFGISHLPFFIPFYYISLLHSWCRWYIVIVPFLFYSIPFLHFILQDFYLWYHRYTIIMEAFTFSTFHLESIPEMTSLPRWYHFCCCCAEKRPVSVTVHTYRWWYLPTFLLPPTVILFDSVCPVLIYTVHFYH